MVVNVHDRSLAKLLIIEYNRIKEFKCKIVSLLRSLKNYNSFLLIR